MNYYYEDYDEDWQAIEMRRESMIEKYRKERLARNPDCRDPSHPGCEHCMGDGDGQDAD